MLDVIPVPTKRERLLRFVIEHPGCTRTDLANANEISRSAVAMIVSELIENGHLAEAASTARVAGLGAGRPSAPLHAVMPDEGALGIDFGHGHVAVALSDLDGTLLARRRVRFDVDHDALGAMEKARELLGQILDESGHGIDHVGTAVASIPGPIDSSTGIVRSPTILSGWVGMDPAAEIANRVGVRASVFNDANLGAWGEMIHGAGRDLDDFIYIKASDGIGAGLIYGRNLMPGVRGLSGEIGHTPSGQDGPMCRCGNRGCVEAVASSAAVRLKLAYTHAPLSEEDSLADLHDEVSGRIFAEAGRVVGKIVADICNLLNPTAIILGGELGAVGPAFVAGVRETVDRVAQPATASSVAIVPASLGRDAELMGAVAKAVQYGRESVARKAAHQHTI